MVQHLVARDRPQPAAEGVALLLPPELADVEDQHLEHFLEDVGQAPPLQLPTAAPGVEQGGVERDEATPGARLIGLDAINQTGRRSTGRKVHQPTPRETGSGKPESPPP